MTYDLLAERKRAREEILARAIDEAHKKAALANLSLTCQAKPPSYHGTCIGIEKTNPHGTTYWERLGCLCKCHDDEIDGDA